MGPRGRNDYYPHFIDDETEMLSNALRIAAMLGFQTRQLTLYSMLVNISVHKFSYSDGLISVVFKWKDIQSQMSLWM